jgi:hypothetical protein
MQHLTFQNRGDRAASGLRALFVPSRTSLLGYRVSSLPDGTAPIAAGVNPRVAELLWEPPIPPGAEVTLSIEFVGEPMTVEELAWREVDGTLRPYGPPLTPGMTLLLGAGTIEDLAVRAREFDRLRCSVVAATQEPRLRAFHMFFCEYDHATNLDLMGAGAGELGLIIKSMSKLLKQRVLERVAWKDDSTEPPDLPRSGKSNVQTVSDLQLGIFHSHFPKSGGDIDVDLFWEAFEMFANGELRLGLAQGASREWDAEPHSAFAFSFAEFAFMAEDLGVRDRERWYPLMKPLVAIQEVYAAAYRPRKGKPEEFIFDDYNLGNYGKGENRLSAEEKRRVRDRYERMLKDERLRKGLRLQAGRNARKAFPAGG